MLYVYTAYAALKWKQFRELQLDSTLLYMRCRMPMKGSKQRTMSPPQYVHWNTGS